MSMPFPKKSVEDLMGAVSNYKVSETIKRWYSDGAPELHAVCRKIRIRQDRSDPHRSETSGLIERTNRTVIEVARCLLFQSGVPYTYRTTAIKCLAGNLQRHALR